MGMRFVFVEQYQDKKIIVNLMHVFVMFVIVSSVGYPIICDTRLTLNLLNGAYAFMICY